MDKEKKLSIAIVIVVIIILLLVLLLLTNNPNIIINNSNNRNISINEDDTIVNGVYINGTLNLGLQNNTNILNLGKYEYEDKPEQEMNKLKYIEDNTHYFTMKAIYNNYILMIENNKTQELMNVLSNKYIEEYGITNKNVLEKMNFVNKKNQQQYKPIIMEILLAQVGENQKIYIIKGNCRITDTNTNFEVNVIIKVDTKERLYEIYPNEYIKDNQYDNLKVGDTIQFSLDNIIKNENNKFNYLVKENYSAAKEYFEHYRELLMFYPEEAYKKIDSEYCESRFENTGLYIPLFELDYEDLEETASDELLAQIEEQQVHEMKKNYEEYLVENSVRLRLMKFDRYIMRYNNEETEYQVTDNLGNTTIYISRGFLNYTVLLDNYRSSYNYSGNVEEEILKFQNIINTKDFSDLYYMRLDSKFTESKFKDVDEFKKYMKENVYTINEIVPVNIKQGDYDIFECRLINKLNKNQYKKLVIIIDDYEMSFSIEN